MEARAHQLRASSSPVPRIQIWSILLHPVELCQYMKLSEADTRYKRKGFMIWSIFGGVQTQRICKIEEMSLAV